MSAKSKKMPLIIGGAASTLLAVAVITNGILLNKNTNTNKNNNLNSSNNNDKKPVITDPITKEPVKIILPKIAITSSTDSANLVLSDLTSFLNKELLLSYYVKTDKQNFIRKINQRINIGSREFVKNILIDKLISRTNYVFEISYNNELLVKGETTTSILPNLVIDNITVNSSQATLSKLDSYSEENSKKQLFLAYKTKDEETFSNSIEVTNIQQNHAQLNLPNLVPDTDYIVKIISIENDITKDVIAPVNFKTLIANTPIASFVIKETSTNISLDGLKKFNGQKLKIKYKLSAAESWTEITSTENVINNKLQVSLTNLISFTNYDLQFIPENSEEPISFSEQTILNFQTVPIPTTTINEVNSFSGKVLFSNLNAYSTENVYVKYKKTSDISYSDQKHLVNNIINNSYIFALSNLNKETSYDVALTKEDGSVITETKFVTDKDLIANVLLESIQPTTAKILFSNISDSLINREFTIKYFKEGSNKSPLESKVILTAQDLEFNLLNLEENTKYLWIMEVNGQTLGGNFKTPKTNSEFIFRRNSSSINFTFNNSITSYVSNLDNSNIVFKNTLKIKYKKVGTENYNLVNFAISNPSDAAFNFSINNLEENSEYEYQIGEETLTRRFRTRNAIILSAVEEDSKIKVTANTSEFLNKELFLESRIPIKNKYEKITKTITSPETEFIVEKIDEPQIEYTFALRTSEDIYSKSDESLNLENFGWLQTSLLLGDTSLITSDTLTDNNIFLENKEVDALKIKIKTTLRIHKYSSLSNQDVYLKVEDLSSGNKIHSKIIELNSNGGAYSPAFLLKPDTLHKAAVYDRDNQKVGEDFHFKTDPIENLNDKYFELTQNDGSENFKIKFLFKGAYKIRFKKLNSDADYQALTKENRETFNMGSGNNSFSHLAFTRNIEKDTNNVFKKWIDYNFESGKYQMIIADTDTDEVYATTSLEDSIIIDRTKKTTTDNNTSISNAVTQLSDILASNNYLNLTFSNLNNHQSENDGLDLFYVEKNLNNFVLDPQTFWTKLPKKVFSTKTTFESDIISITNLKRATEYAVVLLNKNGQEVYRNNSIFTLRDIQMYNSLFADNQMKFGIRNFNGHTATYNKSYKIIYSKDTSYSLSSSTISITKQNANNSFEFDLNSLESNTLYNYKVVNVETGTQLLNFAGTFRTQKDQSVKVSNLRHNEATLSFISPAANLRTKNYYYATHYSVDVLIFQYSEDENFADDNTKEFYLGLNEQNSNFASIVLKKLKNNTKYYFRIQNNKNQTINLLENTSGSFVTLSKDVKTDTLSNQAFVEVQEVTEAQKNNFRFEYAEYKNNILSWNSLNHGAIKGSTLVFNPQNLKPETYYEYRILNSNNEKVSSGLFKTQGLISDLEISDEVVSSTSQRIILKNMNDYLNREITINYKKSTDSNWITKKVKLANDNITFMWDLINLEASTQYEYNVEYISKYLDTPIILKNPTSFTTMAKFNADGAIVSTKVRLYSNFEDQGYRTVTSLQEMYANENNWRDILKTSIKEFLLDGFKLIKKGWHIIDGIKYAEIPENDNKTMFFKYLWQDSENNIKGLKFEFILEGNLIKAKISEAKEKKSSNSLNLSTTSWNDLDLNVKISSFSYDNVFGEGLKDSQPALLLVGGFKFDFQTTKRKESDISIPQIFRYSLEEAYKKWNWNSAWYNPFFAWSSNNNQFVPKTKLLPFNNNFQASWGTNYLGHISSSESVPNLNTGNSFFKLMNYMDSDPNAKIRFTGSFQEETNWQLFNNRKKIFLEYGPNLVSHEVSFKTRRIIYKDKNKLVGMIITIGGWILGEKMFGYPDYNNIYEKNIDENTDISNITWEEFIQNATKISTSPYMSAESPGYSIAAISWESKDADLIDENYKKWDNFYKKISSYKNLSASNNEPNKSTDYTLTLRNYEKGTYIISHVLKNSGKAPTEEEFSISSDEQTIFMNKTITLPSLSESKQYLIKVYKKEGENKTELYSESVYPSNIITPNKLSGNIGITGDWGDTYKFPLSLIPGATTENWKTLLPKYFSKVKMSGKSLGNNQYNWFKVNETNVYNDNAEPDYIAAGATPDKKLIMTKIRFRLSNNYIYIKTWETRWYQMNESETFDTVHIKNKYNSTYSTQNKLYKTSSNTNDANASVITGLILSVETMLEDYKLDNPSAFDNTEAQTAKFSLKLIADAGTYKIGYQKVGSSEAETKVDLTLNQGSASHIHVLNIANANKNESYTVNLYKADGTTLLSTMYVHTPTIIEAKSSSSKKGIGSSHTANGTNGFIFSFNSSNSLKGITSNNYKEFFPKFFAETRNSGTAINPEWTSNSNLGEWTLASNPVYDANSNNPEYIAAAKNSDGTKWIMTKIGFIWYTREFEMRPKTWDTRYVDVTEENKDNPNLAQLFRNAGSTENRPYKNSDTIDNTTNRVVVTGIKFYKKSFDE